MIIWCFKLLSNILSHGELFYQDLNHSYNPYDTVCGNWVALNVHDSCVRGVILFHKWFTGLAHIISLLFSQLTSFTEKYVIDETNPFKGSSIPLVDEARLPPQKTSFSVWLCVGWVGGGGGGGGGYTHHKDSWQMAVFDFVGVVQRNLFVLKHIFHEKANE